MRGFVASILFILVSAQVEAAVCSHFGESKSPESTASYSTADATDCSENGLNNLPLDEMCLSCGHVHLVLFKGSLPSFKFINSDKRILDFQNQSLESLSVQPPIDPPRA